MSSLFYYLFQKKDAVPGFDAVTLDTILNHIAYANTRGSNDGELKTPTRSNTKKQISSILKLTYLVAISGIALSCINVFLILGPYGLYLFSFFIYDGEKRGFKNHTT